MTQRIPANWNDPEYVLAGLFVSSEQMPSYFYFSWNFSLRCFLTSRLLMKSLSPTPFYFSSCFSCQLYSSFFISSLYLSLISHSLTSAHHTHTHTHTHGHTRTHMDTYTHTRTHTCTHTHVHTRTHMYTYTHVHTYTHAHQRLLLSSYLFLFLIIFLSIAIPHHHVLSHFLQQIFSVKNVNSCINFHLNSELFS